ncbi:glycosyl hydrolase family 61-domain-containing protein [Melanogaster broomeanus]|nr:glycosyl hydrolase family 61-domain-containing protein [Melanogaster broomeanus]
MIAFTLFSLILPALVSAHGYVAQVTIDGTVYKGNSVGTTSTIDSVIRQINSNSPVKGASNPDLNCGTGAQLAKDVASANPGSTVEVLWSGGTSGISTWPHNTGPIMHYMAKCDGSCSSYDSANAEWFKISELGLQSDGSTWYQAQLQSGSPATVTIPSTLAAGNYLLRSEIISLQLAMTEGGAEFYPACIQLSVGGSQTGAATSSEEVTFPGGYTDTEAGILTPNIYNPPITYTFPGPPVAAFVSGGSGSTGSGSGSSGSGSSSPSASPTPSSASPKTVQTSTPTPTPSSPINVGGSPPSSSPTTSAPAAPTATPSSGGSNSTCKRRKRSLGERSHVVSNARMHKSRMARSH